MNLGHIQNFSFRALPARTRGAVGIWLIGMFFMMTGCGWAGMRPI